MIYVFYIFKLIISKRLHVELIDYKNEPAIYIEYKFSNCYL